VAGIPQLAQQLAAGHALAQLVDALRYKSVDRGFDSRWCHKLFGLKSGSLNLLEF
jgi:hypothetical protein